MLKKVFCPNCGKPMQADDVYEKVECPYCGEIFVIPGGNGAGMNRERRNMSGEAGACRERRQTPENYSTGMILGILSITGGLIFAFMGIICGIVGLILSEKRSHDPMVNAKAGMILSVIGLAVSVVNSIVGVILKSGLFHGMLL